MKTLENELMIKEILISEDQIKTRIKELGQEILRDYENKSPMLIGVLKGASIFLADLIRQIDLPLRFDFVAISSYGQDTRSSGIVRLIKDVDTVLEGEDILIVEDIIDTGLTLNYLVELLKSRRPASIKICTLLDKYQARKAPVEADYVGFRIENKFVVGYGLDFAEKYRNLPYIGIIEQNEL